MKLVYCLQVHSPFFWQYGPFFGPLHWRWILIFLNSFFREKTTWHSHYVSFHYNSITSSWIIQRKTTTSFWECITFLRTVTSSHSSPHLQLLSLASCRILSRHNNWTILKKVRFCIFFCASYSFLPRNRFALENFTKNNLKRGCRNRFFDCSVQLIHEDR